MKEECMYCPAAGFVSKIVSIELIYIEFEFIQFSSFVHRDY
jgi:hypothetical protein